MAKNKSNIILLDNFEPDYYTWDVNNDEDWLGQGTFGDVYRAKPKKEYDMLVKEKRLPTEIAVKLITAKRKSYREIVFFCYIDYLNLFL